MQIATKFGPRNKKHFNLNETQCNETFKISWLWHMLNSWMLNSGMRAAINKTKGSGTCH